MAKRFVYFGIVVLAAIAIFLGYQIYQQYQLKQSSGTKLEPGQTSVNQSVAPKETDVLNFPGPNASEEETRKFAETVQANAKETGELDISRCEPNPKVLKVKLGSEFKIKNSDPSEHKIYIANREEFSATPDSTVTVKASFGKGPGTYGYGCDGDSTLVGAFFVVE